MQEMLSGQPDGSQSALISSKFPRKYLTMRHGLMNKDEETTYTTHLEALRQAIFYNIHTAASVVLYSLSVLIARRLKNLINCDNKRPCAIFADVSPCLSRHKSRTGFANRRSLLPVQTFAAILLIMANALPRPSSPKPRSLVHHLVPLNARQPRHFSRLR